MFKINGKFSEVDQEFEKLRTQGYRVIGARARFEANQGDGDDTALNGLELALGKIPPLLSVKRLGDILTVHNYKDSDGNWEGKYFVSDFGVGLACEVYLLYPSGDNVLMSFYPLGCDIYRV